MYYTYAKVVDIYILLTKNGLENNSSDQVL